MGRYKQQIIDDDPNYRPQLRGVPEMQKEKVVTAAEDDSNS